MAFASPTPFREALQALEAKRLLPTALKSAEYRQLGADVLRRSMLSSQVTVAEFLQQSFDGIRRIVEGATAQSLAAREAGADTVLLDQAKLRLDLKELLQRTGYQSETGKEGTIQDLSTDKRLDLIIETNVDTAQGYGQWVQGQDETTLDVFPAWELFRLTPVDQERDWLSRWRAVGGRLVDGGRMIALKTDAIWERLGSEFPDGLGNPYPPFAFNSGMSTRDIARDEAIRLGLIAADSPPQVAQDLGLNDTYEVSTAKFDSAIAGALAADPDLRLQDGVLRLAATPPGNRG